VVIRRGEVYFIDLDPALGREQRGRRPVVVLTRDSLNQLPLVAVVVPGTSSPRAQAHHVTNVVVPAGEAGLTQDTVFLTFQVRAVDHSRFTDPPLGVLAPNYIDAIERALAYTLDLPGSGGGAPPGTVP
jgi:mRNA interferase MazF